jgi:hypothetical protein
MRSKGTGVGACGAGVYKHKRIKKVTAHYPKTVKLNYQFITQEYGIACFNVILGE